MRWDDLFADLARSAGEADHAELAAEVADRTRRGVAELRMVDRLRGIPSGAAIRVRTAGGPVEGTMLDVGADWLLLGKATGGRRSSRSRRSGPLRACGGTAPHRAARAR
jgi:hypothetical protein